MATYAQIMDAIADQLRAALSETVGEVQVEPRWVVNPTPPCVDVYPADPSNDPELRAFTEAIGEPLFTVRARVDLSDSSAAQDLLLALMDANDPLSVSAALAADRTLGGVCTSLDVRSVSGYVRVLEGGDFLGCLWQVLVTR